MGRYGVTPDADYPIIWLKATPNCDFITECAIDWIPYDAREPQNTAVDYRYYGHPNYGRSNIHQFLNSDEDQWFHASHPYDFPPSYQNLPGFLTGFEAYEADALLEQRMDMAADGAVDYRVRLPHVDEIFGDSQFNLFRKRGIRVHETEDLHFRKFPRGNPVSYTPYWTCDRYGSTAIQYIDRSCRIGVSQPYSSMGLRPVCAIDPNTVVSQDGSGIYHVKPLGSVSGNCFTDAELIDFLGINT